MPPHPCPLRRRPPRYALRLLPGTDGARVAAAAAEGGGGAVAPSRYLPDEFIVVASGLQGLLEGGLVSGGHAQARTSGSRAFVCLVFVFPRHRVFPRPGAHFRV